MPAEPEHLLQRVLSFMRGESADTFEQLALDVFAHQYMHNAPYRSFCDARGAHPGSIHHWTRVPAVPADAFKAVPLICATVERAVAEFRTSGTTRGTEKRGSHFVLDLEPYRVALRLGFERHLLPDGVRLPVIGLVPPAHEVPDASLSHMVADVMETFGTPPGGWYVSASRGLAIDALLERLAASQHERQPVLLAGTSFTFVHIFDSMRERDVKLQLPTGSRVMDTGGFKGRSREVQRAELIDAYADLLGIPSAWVVNEYGMTEMTSQFYDGVAGREANEERHYEGPAWVRTCAADPETLDLLPPGSTGVLRHWDLGNVNSVMPIQTADMGRQTEEGFQLFGRAAGAEARGCSLAMDELLESIHSRDQPG